MRIRPRRKILHPSQNLDSFLDILTNTVGVLMFISLFVSLLAVESGNIIKTPLVSKTNKIPFFFEVRDNKVMYIDTPRIQQQIDDLLESLPKCNKPEIPDNFSSYLYEYYLQQYESYRNCVSELQNKVNGFRGDTDYYSVHFLELNALIYEPKTNVQGESIEQLSEDKSNFQQLLNSLDKRRNYLAFIVRPESFNGFRRARKKALEAGFDVGWEPSETDIPIVFGSGGRSIGVQ